MIDFLLLEGVSSHPRSSAFVAVFYLICLRVFFFNNSHSNN